jgi:hypothetical protein
MRKNLTYKKRLTKYQEKRKHREIAIFLIIFFSLSLGNMLVERFSRENGINIHLLAQNTTTGQLDAKNNITSNQPEITNTKTIDDLEIIVLNSINPENQKTVYLASFQACKKHSIEDLENCARDLMAMAATETGNSFNFKAVGDGGKSKGIFQIHQGYHKHIINEQAFDPYFAADWALTRMINYGYKTNRDFAIMKHNGTPNTPNTLYYLSKVNKYKNLSI